MNSRTHTRVRNILTGIAAVGAITVMVACTPSPDTAARSLALAASGAPAPVTQTQTVSTTAYSTVTAEPVVTTETVSVTATATETAVAGTATVTATATATVHDTVTKTKTQTVEVEVPVEKEVLVTIPVVDDTVDDTEPASQLDRIAAYVNAIFNAYGDIGTQMFCKGDYTGSPAEQAVMGAEDSPQVNYVFTARDAMGAAPAEVIC